MYSDTLSGFYLILRIIIFMSLTLKKYSYPTCQKMSHILPSFYVNSINSSTCPIATISLSLYESLLSIISHSCKYFLNSYIFTYLLLVGFLRTVSLFLSRHTWIKAPYNAISSLNSCSPIELSGLMVCICKCKGLLLVLYSYWMFEM